MELTPELLGTGIVGILVIVGAIGQYLRTYRARPTQLDPVLAGVGLELGNRQQADQIIFQLKRIADALTDKNTADVNDRLDELAEKVDDALHHRQTTRRRTRR